MVKCPECNAENPDGTNFCSECGAKLEKSHSQETPHPTFSAEKEPEKNEQPAEPSAANEPAPKPQQPPVFTQVPPPQQQQYQQVPPQMQFQQQQPPQFRQPPYPYPPAAPQNAENDSPALGTGAYFGLLLLFSIPFVNLIAAIIMGIAAKNRNMKHFALAQLIWIIIGIVISVISIVMIVLFGEAIYNAFYRMANSVVYSIY